MSLRRLTKPQKQWRFIERMALRFNERLTAEQLAHQYGYGTAKEHHGHDRTQVRARDLHDDD